MPHTRQAGGSIMPIGALGPGQATTLALTQGAIESQANQAFQKKHPKFNFDGAVGGGKKRCQVGFSLDSRADGVRTPGPEKTQPDTFARRLDTFARRLESLRKRQHQLHPARHRLGRDAVFRFRHAQLQPQ